MTMGDDVLRRLTEPYQRGKENVIMTDRMTGFKPLKAGRIHLRCYACGRKMSNMDRQADDPPDAVLCETECDKHHGSIEPPIYFYAADCSQVYTALDREILGLEDDNDWEEAP